MEDLAVKALARTRLAKSVHDAGWSAFGRFEQASQVCAACGAKDGPKPR